MLWFFTVSHDYKLTKDVYFTYSLLCLYVDLKWGRVWREQSLRTQAPTQARPVHWSLMSVQRPAPDWTLVAGGWDGTEGNLMPSLVLIAAMPRCSDTVPGQSSTLGPVIILTIGTWPWSHRVQLSPAVVERHGDTGSSITFTLPPPPPRHHRAMVLTSLGPTDMIVTRH